MAITVQLLALGSTAAGANVQIGTQTLAAPSTWTLVTGLNTPTVGGFKVRASSDAEAFRIRVLPPVESSNPSGPTPAPRSQGNIVPWPNGQAYEEQVFANSQVWVKQT